MFAVYDHLPISGWIIVAAFNDSQLFSGLEPIRNVIILMVVLIGVLAGLLAILFSVIISRPIRNLSHEVASIDVQNIGHAHIEQFPTRSYEVSVLRESINILFERIQQLIEDIETRQSENLRMQNSLLLSQINPHFLYNMLYAIAQECRLGETDEASDMLYELSAFFRLGLNSGREIVTLSDEKEHVLSYLKLISRSFPYGLEWDIDIDDSLLQCRLPRMTLQPVVENCYKHGLRNRRQKGMIRIKAIREGRELSIHVSDNGIGIAPERLAAINAEIAEGRHTKGFGMYNVSQRLKNYFGPLSMLHVESEEGKGTDVNITIIYEKEDSYD